MRRKGLDGRFRDVMVVSVGAIVPSNSAVNSWHPKYVWYLQLERQRGREGDLTAISMSRVTPSLLM
jgi:hypothetical protein